MPVPMLPPVEREGPEHLRRVSKEDFRARAPKQRKPLTSIPAGAKRVVCVEGRSRRQPVMTLRLTREQRMAREALAQPAWWYDRRTAEDRALELRISELAGKVITFAPNSKVYPVLADLESPGPRIDVGNCPFCKQRHWRGTTRKEG